MGKPCKIQKCYNDDGWAPRPFQLVENHRQAYEEHWIRRCPGGTRRVGREHLRGSDAGQTILLSCQKSHPSLYEALFRIYWSKFKDWLQQTNQSLPETIDHDDLRVIDAFQMRH